MSSGGAGADGDRVTMSASWWQLARGRGARWGVVVLWVLGAILSYSALRELALMLGFPEALADMFPGVVDVAVWVGAMNALEAREREQRVVERYAWSLVALYSCATVAGNALVAGTEAVDPRLIHALGDGWAHAVSGIAHATPAVTMILFAHLAGLLMGRGRAVTSMSGAMIPEIASAQADAGGDHGHVLPAWPNIADTSEAAAEWPAMAGHPNGHGRVSGAAMSAEEAREAVARLVRDRSASGRNITVAEIQQVTGRSERHARRLLAVALAASNSHRGPLG
jgi:Protein of unknown function (DUF2637)